MSNNSAIFIAIQSGVATLAEGEPGITKTRTLEAFAKHVNRTLEVVTPSQREPADICGYPHITEVCGKKCCEFVPAAWRIRLEDSPNQGFAGGFAFLDEVYDCSPAHQAAIQQVLNDGIANTWVAGAGNPVACSTNGYELSAPAVNRLCVLAFDTPVAIWKDNLLNGFAGQSQTFPILPGNWKTYLSETRSLVAAFIEAHPDIAQKLPKARSEQGKPWPSLRSWTNAATVLAAGRSVHAKAHVLASLVQGCVGEAAQIQFSEWTKALDLPPVVAVLEDPTIFDFAGARGDRTYAVLSGVVAHVLTNDLCLESWNKAWNVLGYASVDALSIATTMATSLSRKKGDGWAYPEVAKKKFVPILKEAMGL